MALTPADVHNQQFTTVRMRTGYDMDEVDVFLDVVETEIARLLAENDDLRAQVTQAQSRALAAEQRATAAEAPSEPPKQVEVERVEEVGASTEVEVMVVDEVVDEAVENVVEDAEEVVEDTQVATRSGGGSVDETGALEPIVAVVTPSEQTPAAEQSVPSEQALKILEIAQRTADETVAHAHSEASTILSRARSEAAEITADLDAKREALEEQVGRLRTFERNYRVALRDHIAGQLAQFDRAASQEESVAGPTPAIESVQTSIITED